MTSVFEVRPTARGRVIGVGLGQFRFVGRGVALMLGACALLTPCALAGPEGGKVSAGQATITTIGGRTVIRSSNGSIIDWASFNLNRDEYVKFLQAGANSRILNRINSATPSAIDGRIWSNGTVYFSNPAGVIFGPNAVLNVGGIYAAAGRISNEDFTRGVNHFTDVHGVVSNAGRIETAQGGLAALVGERVVNSGTISAPKGVIAMVAGNEVTFIERGGTMAVRVSTDTPGAGKDGVGVENTGTIGADRGSAFMVAGDMYSLAVRNAPTGTVRARDITVEGQGHAAVEVSGTLDASNQRGNAKGGSITVTGETVRLTGATLDASGQREGGSVRVGGEYQGGAGVRSATYTSVDSASAITADAVDSGSGGRVIVWANDTTHVGGSISASGGAAGGDGGFIETSGKINLDIRGAKIQARAGTAGGKAGLWLMDPTNVDISDPTGGDDTTNVTTGGPGTTITPDGMGPAVVDVNTINAALNGGTDVTILTGSVGTDDGNIGVNAAILKSSGTDARLTLRAANNIDVNATIGSTSGKLNVDLQANSSGMGNDDLDGAAGNVSINAAITTNGGDFHSSGVNYTQNVGGTVTTDGGAVSIVHDGTVAIGDAIAAGGGMVSISSVGDLTLNSAVGTSGTGEVSLTSTMGSVLFGTGSSATADPTGAITVTAANDIVAPADTTDLLTAGTVNLTATSGGIGIANPLRINAATLRAMMATEATIISSSTDALDAAITGGAGSTISLEHAGLLSIASGQTITGGKITLTAADIDVGGTVSSDDVLTISRSASGTIGLGDATGDLTISKDELSRLTAQTLVIGSGTTTAITSANVADADLSSVNAVQLLALADGGDVVFNGLASTFKNLLVRADDSIRVQVSLTSSVGTLSLHADDDGASDSDGDRIYISDGAVISTVNTTGGAIALSASGGIQGAGAVLIDSNTDLLIDNAISSVGTMTLLSKGAMTLNGMASGAGITMDAGSGIALNASVTSTGTSGITIDADHDASGAGTLALASGATITTTNENLTISAADVALDGMVQAGTGSVTIGRSSAGTIGLGSGTGDMQISGTELGGIHAASLTIGNASTTGMTVDTVAAGDTAGITSLLSLVTDAIDITGPINTSDAGLAISRATMGDIALGSAVGGLNISSAELAQITSKGLTIGGSLARNVFVNGVGGADTAGVDNAVTLIASNTVSFIAAPSEFKALTVRANNGVHINVNLTTTVGDMDFDGDANTTADTDDAITIASARTLSSAGQILMRSQTGGIVGNGSLTLQANTGITLFNDATTSGLTILDADHNANGDGSLTISSGRVLATSGNELQIMASDLTLDGSIQTNAGSVSITRSSLGTIGLGTATGDMTISGDELGRIIATGMTIGGPGVTRMIVSGVTSTNSNGIAGTTTLKAGGKIVFNNGASTFNALDVKATRGVRVSSNLSTDAGKLRLDGDSDHTGGDFVALNANLTADIPPATSGGAPTVVFNVALLSDVTLGANVVVTGNNVTFTGDIDSADSTSRPLTVNTFNNGTTTFGGNIGTRNRLFTLATNNDGSTLLGGRVLTNGAIGFSDRLFLTGDTAIDAQAGQGVLFNSTVDTWAGASGPMSLTVLMPLGSAPAGINFPTISFAAPVGATRALKDINLNTDGVVGRDNVPAIATVFARPRDNTGTIQLNPTSFAMSFTTTGVFRMGTNEKLTVDGSLTINAAQAIVGDINAIGNLRVNSPDIEIRLREPGKVLTQSNGIALDQGVDIVAAGTVDFTSIPTLLGTGSDPRFGTPNGGGDVSGTLSAFLFQAMGTIAHGDINPTGSTLRTLDLLAQGPTNTNIASSLAGAIPQEVRENEVSEQTTLTSASFAAAEQIGINLREPSAAELVSLLHGTGTLSDYTPSPNLMTAEDTTTVVSRLPAERVRALLASYDQAFNKPLLDENGKPVLDEHGKVRRVSRAQEMQDALYESVRRYRDAANIKSSDIDPSAFRAYLEQTPAESESLGYVRQLETFLDKLELIGLTAREMAQSEAIILNPIRPRGIRNVQQFKEIIRADRMRVMK